jgi:hypothetical protein
MPNPNGTVLLKGSLDPIEEARASESIDPGSLIEMLSTGSVQMNDKVAGTIQMLVALEDAKRPTGTITDPYLTNELVMYHVCRPGDLVFLRVPAAAVAIVKGDSLEAAANGVVQKLSAGVRVAIAEEAINNSGGGTKEWVKARII